MMKLSNNEKDENPVAESPRRASILRRLVVGYSSRPGSFESWNFALWLTLGAQSDSGIEASKKTFV